MEGLSVRVKANDSHKIAAYHFLDKGTIIDSFVFDHQRNKKIIFQNNNQRFEFSDISPCGSKVMTINDSFVKNERKTKIFHIESQEILFETSDFFGYEAIFSSIPNLIICRGNINKKSNKSFIYDIEKREVVHIMKGVFCLTDAGECRGSQSYIYPNSKKKDEIIVLNLKNLEEKTISLKEKSIVQKVLPLSNGDYLIINASIDAFRIDKNANIIWKRKLDFDKHYYAPECFEFDNEIIFSMYEHIRLSIDTGEIKIYEPKIKGLIEKYFGNTALAYRSIIIDLKTRETSPLSIK